MKLAELLYGPPAARTDQWHPVPKLLGIWEDLPMLPTRTIDGDFIDPRGDVWRRWNGREWEYKQEEIPPEDWL